MRIQIDLDVHVMSIVKSLAAERGQSLGKIISDLLRETLTPKTPTEWRNGFPLFAKSNNCGVVTNEQIDLIKNGVSNFETED